jgi:hypothetical protein
MRSVHRFIILALTAVLFYQCQREVSYIGTGDPGPATLPSPITAHLQGNVLDENGQPAANVVIKVGSEITATNDKGYFRIDHAPLDKNAALVIAEKNGYFTAYRTFGATSGTNQVVLKLVKKNLGGTVSATSGGEISLTNGTKVSLPANGIVKASDNSSFTGTVNVYASYIDPTAPDILERVPGSFMANDKDGKRVLLNSYGMMAVELESSTGEKLQIKSGNTATITSPIPSAAQASAPATIPLWYVDELTGLWKEEGTATRQGSVYIGTVKHFTYWNCDIPVPTVSLSATFKTAGGQPLINASIVIRPAAGTYYGSAHGYTDSLGQMKGPVPANMPLILEIAGACGNIAYSQNIGPYNESVSLGTVTLSSSTPSIVTIKGKLTNCGGTNVANGFAIVSVNNMVHNAKVDATGNFTTNYVLCNTNNVNVQVLGVDDGAQQQGNSISAPVTAPVTDIGTVSACGTSATQSIDYTVDGVTRHFQATDSTTAYSIDTTGTVGDFTYILISNNINDYLEFEMNSTAPTPGTYALTRLGTQAYMNTTLVKPFNVNLTSYAQSVGQFYEGNFSGQFKDALNATHTITCTFRVRRTH